MSEWAETHLPCPCGTSSDAYSINDEGWGKCFRCNKNFREGEAVDVEEQEPRTHKKKKRRPLIDGEYKALIKRKISEETCRFFRYEVGEFKGKACHIANYFDERRRKIAQKIRLPGKDFTITGDMSEAGLFGEQLWKPGGKRLIITEGEMDALSYAEVTDCKWPVVSVRNGAQGAPKCVQKRLEFIESFEEVVFMFDQDEPGQEAATKCAELLSPGKAKIASFQLKDANDMLVERKVRELINSVFQAKDFRPDGIIEGADITIEELITQPVVGYSCKYPDLNEKLRGIRKGELTLFTAGSGIGKSTIVRELGYEFSIDHKLSMANVFLEESYKKTAQGYIAIHHNTPLGEIRRNPNILTPEQWAAGKAATIDRMSFYNHFGSLECDNLIGKLNYFSVGLGCDFILLDHISMVVSGLESDKGERKDIDILMTNLRSLIERTGVGVIAIVHLKRPDGKRKSFNEGGRISLQDLRGSASLEQLSDNIIAIERDQQGEGDDPDLSYPRVLKNREWGDLGPAGCNRYHRDTGRLLPEDNSAEEDFNGEDDVPWEEDTTDI